MTFAERKGWSRRPDGAPRAFANAWTQPEFAVSAYPMLRTGAVVALLVGLGCHAPPPSNGTSSPQATERRDPASTFAIYQVDEEHDITTGAANLPEGVRIFHDSAAPKNGYFCLQNPEVTEADAVDHLRKLTFTRTIPAGDAVVFGATPDFGVRTYLVKENPIVNGDAIAAFFPSMITDERATLEVKIHRIWTPSTRKRTPFGSSRAHCRPRTCRTGAVRTFSNFSVFNTVSRTSRSSEQGRSGV